MKEVFKAFKHLAREIIIYLIPGFLLFFDIVLILNINDCSFIKEPLFREYLLGIGVIFSYVFGHLGISLREVFVKLFCSEESSQKTKPEQLDMELSIYDKDKDRYEYYIERYNLLYAIRKNLTWISIIILITNIIVALSECKHICFYIISIGIALISVFIFGFNAHNTKQGFEDRIKKLWDLNKEKP